MRSKSFMIALVRAHRSHDERAREQNNEVTNFPARGDDREGVAIQ